MDPFDKVHRQGVDVATVFRSGVQRGLAEGSRTSGSQGRRSGDSLTRSLVDKVRSPLTSRSGGRKAGVGKAIARPFLVRLRRFFFAPIEQELREMRDTLMEVSRSTSRVAVPTRDGNVLVRTDVGYVLCSTDDLGTLATLIEAGGIEHGTRLVIERIVSPGAVYVDVGANLGLHTLAAARAMNRRGRIHAFEPFQPTASLLRETLKINGFGDLVQLHEAAASDHQGRQQLYLGDVSGHHSLFPLTGSEGIGSRSVEVELVTLDEALAGTPPATLIKIDVEGNELAVLEGARSTIERSPDVMLIVEFGPSHLMRAGVTPTDWFALFERMGFVFRAIDDDGRLTERTIAALEQVDSANLLFARQNSASWTRAGAG